MATSKRGYHHGDLERALISAACDLVERDGAARFSVAEACKRAGVSTAAPYRHFRDKDDILAHVKKAGFEDLTARMLRERDAAGAQAPVSHGGAPRKGGDRGARSEADETAIRRIAATGKVYVDFALTRPETFALMFGGKKLAITEEREAEVASTGSACFDILIGEVARFLGHTAAETEARELSVMLWSFVHGVAALARDKDYDRVRFPVDTARLVDRSTRAVLTGARGLASDDAGESQR